MTSHTLTLVEPAPAKLNLALHVRRRRDDGFHELETLFAFVRDGDLLTVSAAEADSFAIVGPFATGLDAGWDNLVLRAVRAFADIAPLPPLAITLDKRLPVASGIGGGSADAAAALRACADIAGIDRADPRLFAAAAGLGSDVPACLDGGTTIGAGRGEALRRVAGLAGVPVLLVNPGVAVSTRDVFARWDGIDRGPLPGGGAAEIARTGRNDLTAPARQVAPVIGDVLRALDGLGTADLVRMSGSGATCFALFENDDARDRADATIRATRPGWWTLATALA